MTEATPSAAMIPPEERMLAMMTHLSGLAGYVVPLGGVIVPIVIWVMKKDHRIISAIAKQAVMLNVAVFVCALALFALALTIILLPVSILGWVLLGLAALALPIIGAVKASDGKYYAYPIVGTRL